MDESQKTQTATQSEGRKKRRRVKAASGDANGKPKQSSPVADIESGVKGVQLTLREDGSVTMILRRQGLAPKVMTMYPLQWEALMQVAPTLAGRFNNPGTPIIVQS